MEISVIGIDLAKDSFAVCGMSKTGKVLLRKALSRKSLIEFTAKLSPTLIAFEACGGSHYWARLCQRQGHRVKMMPVQRVKAFTPPQKKNDASDAEAIGLAALSEAVSSVRIKGTDQQDIEMFLNLREQLVKQRVAVINQAHAVALEYGVMLPKAKTASYLERVFSEIEDGANELTSIAREVIFDLIAMAKELDAKATKIEQRLKSLMSGNENFRLLQTIPGVGLLTATAILAHTGGNVSSFKCGRQFAAYLGLTPRQHSTGGKTKLVGITRCGQSTIRKFLVVGTNSVMRVAEKKTDRVSLWVTEKKSTRGYKKASVALANKTARIVYAILKTQQPYQAA